MKNLDTFWSYAIMDTKTGTRYRVIRKQSNLPNEKYEMEGWDCTLLHSFRTDLGETSTDSETSDVFRNDHHRHVLYR